MLFFISVMMMMIVEGDVDRVANESGCRNGGVSVCSDSGWDGNVGEGGGGCDSVESGEVGNNDGRGSISDVLCVSRSVDVNVNGSLMVVSAEKTMEQVMMRNGTIMVRIVPVILAALLKVTMMLTLIRVVIIMIIE